MANKKLILSISGMTCEHCAITIEKQLDNKDGIITKHVNFQSGLGEFIFDDNISSKRDIVETINSTNHYKVIGENNDKNNTNNKFDLIVIGGGSAAFAAALRASNLNKKVLIINNKLPIGGTCVNVGCIPSKILVRNAEAFYYMNYPNFMDIKHGDNKIDFKKMIKEKTELVEDLRKRKYIDVIKDDNNISVIHGNGKLIDKNTVYVNGEYKKGKIVLIATGSSTFVPNIPGLQDIDYLTNDTLYELDQLPRHLIIIGGRFIALENAQIFARLGSKITVLQRSKRIIPNESDDISILLTQYLTEEGVDIKTGIGINKIEKINGEIRIHITTNEKKEIIHASHILIATGRYGNSHGIGLESLGIKTYGNGFIKTDEYLRTNVDNILAAGDITGDHLFVYVAAYEGTLSVDNAFGNNSQKKDFSILPWVMFTDPQVAGVGMDEKSAKQYGINYDVSKIELKDIPRSITGRNTKGFIKLIRNRKNNKLIGARILANGGSELLMEIVLAIKLGITVDQLKAMFHPYLTLSEGIKLALIGFDKDINKLSCCAV